MSLAVAVALAASVPQPVGGKPANDVKAVPLKSEGPPGRGGTQRSSFRGNVTAIDRKSIAILAPHGSVSLIFPFERSFAEAKVPPGGPNDDQYVPQDVRVGDRVAIRYADDGTRITCYQIVIQRRPGGRVPPGFDPTLSYSPHSELMNAYQDWEEKGIAIPAKYRGTGRLDYLDPPYPPYAPMPRKAVPRAEAPKPREVGPPTITSDGPLYQRFVDSPGQGVTDWLLGVP